MTDFFWFILAAASEIIGCYLFWGYWRLGKSPLWMAGGVMVLALFACALSQTGQSSAGRNFAIYGGIYIVASVFWMVGVENINPDKWDFIGVTLCLAGAAIMVFSHRI